MTFWTGFIGCIAATVVVYLALSINGVTEHAGGHDDHGHGGHDDHGHAHH